ncbi:DMT family transporter [Desulfamplus magnetovallimortis]|uniref:DMT family transporter n=1 Tax=Desulfamplus magnetovallimortis TaxID=1246637 RepID=UPI00164442A9|nr:DMT family transporter [Desulfamplus magnetovallimortis]
MKISFPENKKTVAFILLTTSVLSWSLNTVLARGMINDIHPLSLSFFRWFTALCVIIPIGLKSLSKEWEILKKNWLKMLVLSILSVTLYNTLIYCSAGYTTATNMSLIISATPALTFLLSRIFLGSRESLARTSGMLISLAGMMLIIFKGDIFTLISLKINTGDLITCGAILSWAVYSVLLRLFRIDVSPIAFLTAIIVLGLPFIFPFYLWEYNIYGAFDITVKNVLILLFLGIFPSILSYLCWNEGVKLAGPNTASMFFYLIPVFASFIAFVFLGEEIYWYHILGGGIIFSGFFLTRNQ